MVMFVYLILYASFIDFQNIYQNANISTRIDLVETLND